MRIVPPSRVLLACALALLAPAAFGANFGTLFHTAEERERLDRLRRGEPEAGRYVRSGPPTVTGYVKRSDGRHTVWIDGAPVPVATPESARLLDSVRTPAERSDGTLKIERKTPR